MATGTADLARGRHASRPSEIPRKGLGDVLFRVKDELADDYMGMAAAGVAFYALLALFPAIVALVSIYGLVFDSSDVERQMQSLMTVIPPQAAGIIEQQLHSVASQPSSGLGWGVALGIAFALWSSAKGVKAIIKGLNIAYDEEENRGFFKLNGLALLLTLAGIVFTAAALLLIAVLPVAFNFMGLSPGMQTALSLLRWPILLVVVLAMIALFYRYGPDRTSPQWQWVSWGAIGATVLWLIGSILFSFYVSNFGSFSETYGSLGAVVVLMLWLWLSAYILLLGAEFNAELEHQTEKDTTVGPERPMGQRGARMADTLGHTR